MKNYKLKIFAPLLSLALAFTACDNYLDESPDDRLELDTLEKAAKVVADSYSQASYAFTDIYTDLAGPTGNPDGNGIVQTAGGNFIRIQDQQVYTWDEVDAIFQDTPTFFWDQSYEAIAHANEVLAVIDDLEGDKDFKDAIIGEALLSRAYNHFMLVNMFGLHYDGNAGSNLGIPYISSPETEFLPSYTRNTVQEVYDLVEADLLKGLSLIDDRFFSGTKKYHFTRKAGLAFASRFYLWKRDYTNCKKYSDLFLDGSPSIYVKNYDDLQGSGYNDIADKYGDPTDESNVLVMTKISNHQRRGTGYRLNNTDVNRLFANPLGARDERTSTGIWRIGTDARYLSRLREFFFRENLSSNSGTPYHIGVELKGEEVVLNRAEANLQLGDQAAALADINVLARERYNDAEFTDLAAVAAFYGAPDEATGLLALILDERAKEFWDHGLRWFDIKRYNIPVTHVLPVSEGGGTLELTANDLRKAVQIPQDAQSFGISPNPR
ncbi:RagB/SusD family nutrient uptake outer membrane protein [Aquimarina sp. MMG016]|uniref:RagB/SusD family nutrient uptake outer membrane protein n=1 Tax=Aquimarina sp. MMG016 TaxID=2822690 RepID=UPI001B3A2D55|nr:RagB/SusD family nutrient uptake outer membrane protein [Aquimarina sp. MMG016]MBQ4821823.1 RagB/SusD family nutrient uptake outer membrane protein [Aquimarina sp. MMG016]